VVTAQEEHFPLTTREGGWHRFIGDEPAEPAGTDADPCPLHPGGWPAIRRAWTITPG
jgi:hypothetical protein